MNLEVLNTSVSKYQSRILKEKKNMSLIQIQNEHISKILFKSLIYKLPIRWQALFKWEFKMWKLVQSASQAGTPQ